MVEAKIQYSSTISRMHWIVTLPSGTQWMVRYDHKEKLVTEVLPYIYEDDLADSHSIRGDERYDILAAATLAEEGL